MLPRLLQLDSLDKERYLVEAIINKKEKRQVKYLVKQEGQLKEYNKQVNKEDINKEAVHKYKQTCITLGTTMRQYSTNLLTQH